jgi:hypothetical protein
MVNYCGNYSGKSYGSGRGAKGKSISQRICGSGPESDWCINTKTQRYERHKGPKIKRTFQQSHDGKFCRPRRDKSLRDFAGRKKRIYDTKKKIK